MLLREVHSRLTNGKKQADILSMAEMEAFIDLLSLSWFGFLNN